MPPLIVIIDDIPRNIQLVGQMLKNQGYRVLALTDSTKAVKTIEKNQPSLVLLDIMMPEIDGYEVCSALKSNPKTVEIPVIFLTAKAESYDVVKGFEIGGVDYVTKPFNNQELLMRVKTQVTLQNAIKAAKKANAAKSDFLANISHDIRSPMNGIMNVMDLLLKSEITSVQKNYIKIARQAGTSLLCLINDLLDLSKIEAQQLSLDHIQFDLRELLESISDMYAIEAYKKGLEYACIIPDNFQPMVLGDPNRLRQIIINLVNNAIKFTHQGEVSIHVRQQADDTIHFAIQDTGKGIPANRLNQLFKPYDQLDSSTSRKYGGTGLGLSISKQLVNLMNGEIHVQSEENKGATFSFTAMLPRQDAKTGNPALKKNLESVNALVIHRHEKSRQALVNLLKTFNCQCYEANNSASTLAALRDLNIKLAHCRLLFIDKETYDEDIFLIHDKLKDNPASHSATWILLKKIGTESNLAFDELLSQPVHYESLLSCLEKTFQVQPVEEAIPARNCALNKVLVIDDEVINQMIAENTIQDIGYHTDIASNCTEALAKLEQNDYLFVFSDLYMPDMSAIELTKIIRSPESDVKNHQIKIVVVSASDLKTDKESCMNAGVDVYMTKPYKANQLKHVIDRFEF